MKRILIAMLLCTILSTPQIKPKIYDDEVERVINSYRVESQYIII